MAIKYCKRSSRKVLIIIWELSVGSVYITGTPDSLKEMLLWTVEAEKGSVIRTKDLYIM